MSLKNLIALQKGKTNVTPAAAVDSSPRADDAAPVESGGEADSAESVPSGEAPAPESVAAEAEPAPAKPAGLGLNLLKAGRAVGQSAPKPPARSLAKGPSSIPAKPSAVTESTDGAVFSLEDLAGFDANDDSAPARSSPSLDAGFDDEIEATAPDRVLPADITQQQLQFVESLDGIYPVLHDPELFGQAVRIIMLELQDNKEYKKLLADQDVHTMIRGMRNTMGMAKVRKQEKSRKTGTAGKKSARGKSAVSDEDMALLDALMGGA